MRVNGCAAYHPFLNFFATFFFQEKKVEGDYSLKVT